MDLLACHPLLVQFIFILIFLVRYFWCNSDLNVLDEGVLSSCCHFVNLEKDIAYCVKKSYASNWAPEDKTVQLNCEIF